MQVQFDLISRTPLLMHPDDISAADDVKRWQQDSANKNISVPGDDRSPAWTWHTRVYRDEDGNIAMPSENIMVCLRQAGSQMKLKGNTTFKALSQSGLLMQSEFCDFFCKEKKIEVARLLELRDLTFEEQAELVKEFGFTLFVKRAKVGTSKHIRVRPRFGKWRVRGVLEIMAKEITFDHLSTMFEIAGRTVGLCDWRPGCKTPGTYGMFESQLKKI